MTQSFPGVLALLALALYSGCARPFPILPGEALTYSRADTPVAPGGEGYHSILQIRWLGTACHWIQLGDAAVFTDPYFTHFGPARVAFGTVESDPQHINQWTSSLPRPRAIFVGHAHYDHLLDLAEVRRQRSWQGVSIIGGRTGKFVVAGYGEGIEADWREPSDSGWVELDEQVAYRAFCARHAPHLPGVLFFPGRLTEPRTTRPTRALHFPVGETYTYLLRLKNPAGSEFTVFFAGAATDGYIGVPDDLETGVDVAILCVPGWKNVSQYPEEVIRRLRPRVIVLSHLDNFLQDGWEKRQVVATAGLRRWLEKARAASTHPEFERIVLTDMGSTIRVAKR